MNQRPFECRAAAFAGQAKGSRSEATATMSRRNSEEFPPDGCAIQGDFSAVGSRAKTR